MSRRPAVSLPFSRRQGGFVLIFVLWVLAGCSLLLAAYAKSAGKTTVTEALATAPLRQRALENVTDFVAGHMVRQTVTADSRWTIQNSISEMEYQQSNGVNAAVAQLAESLNQLGFTIETPDSTSFSTRLTEQRTALESVSDGQTGSYTMNSLFSTGSGQTIQVGGQGYAVDIQPAAVLPNLNTLPASALKRYLLFLGLTDSRAEALTVAVRHWRGDSSVSGSGSAEAVYNSSDTPYKARGGPLADWGEVYWLAGASPDLVEFLKSNFSLAGTESRILMQRDTSPELLAALADIDVSAARDAIAHLTDTSGENASQALSDVIGATAAGKFEQAVMTSGNDSLPVRIQVSEKAGGKGLVQTLVYDPQKKTLTDGWRGNAAFPAVSALVSGGQGTSGR